jgi:hypothetical protein
MSCTRFAVAAAVSILGASLVATPAAQATTFNFLSPAGSLGATQSYTADGLTITAAGFNSSNFTTPDVNLFAKTGGGDENGLGLTNDPSGDKEISFNSYIRIAIPSNAANVSFTMDSTTGGEIWAVYGSNSATALGTLLAAGSTERTSRSLPLYSYYFFTNGVPVGNVLLGSLTMTDPPAPTPLPGALPLFGGGLGAMGLLGWRRKRKAQATA